jgi:carbohydrate-binding DOMON domain-containing protein
MKATRWTLVALVLLLAGPAWAFDTITFKDPTGDDFGHGTVKYPTASVYKPGSFDMTAVEIKDKGDNVEISVTLKSRIEDPWDSKSWTPPGQGFSLQFIQIYIDTDRKPGSGHKKALPGINITFPEDSRWDKVVLISPQPVSRLKAEIAMKAKEFSKDVVVPSKVHVKGKTFTVTVPKKELGDPTWDWGWQVVVQSNEGFPDAEDLLTRDVNEIEGEHRFGGGSDWDCDPHAIDILAGEAKGADSEKEAQKQALKHTCAGSDMDKAVMAVVPMIVPKK